MNLENSLIDSNPPIPGIKPDKNVAPIEKLDEYQTIYFRWYLNNHKDKKITTKMENEKQQLDLLAFSEKGYSRDGVMRDYEKVLRRRENDTLFKNFRAMIFEHIISENIELHNWMGDNALTYKTTEYDDRMNHTDLVVEWDEQDEEEDEKKKKEKQEPIRLAIDCTIAESTEVLDKKVDYISKELNDFRMTTIKYFESDIDFKAHPIKDVPRIILAIDKNKLEELCKNFINLSKSDKKWQENYLQLFFLEEIKEQIKKQLDLLMFYVNENNYKNSSREETDYSKERIMILSEKLKRVLDLIEKIIKEKEEKMPENVLINVQRDMKKTKALGLINNAYDKIMSK